MYFKKPSLSKLKS